MSRISRARRRERSKRSAPGTAPGVITPQPGAARAQIHLIAYDQKELVEREITNIGDIRNELSRWPVTWLNVDGVADTATVEEIGKLFQFHPLALEDVVHVHQRAKMEPYPEYIYFVARMPRFDSGAPTEQISLFLGANYVVTFQEDLGDCLDPLRVRIRAGSGRIRSAGPDYLFYSLLDTIIDHYFPLLEQCGDRLEELESELLSRPTPAAIARLHETKRTLLSIRRAAWPLRDALTTLMRAANPLLHDETFIYLRDCHDHTVQIIDLLENYRDIASGLTDVYLSRLSQLTNEIMKVLTIISTIFIPLTFIVGLYGMNFDTSASPWNMPELHARYGYPAVLVVMGILAAALLIYFRRKGWIGAGAETGSAKPEHPSKDEGA